MKKCLVCVVILTMLCPPAFADELSEIKDMMRQMQAQMNAMAERIAQLEEDKQTQSARDKREIHRLRQRVAELEEQPGEKPASLLSTLNPEVSVIGDVVYTTDENNGEGDNDFNLREVEIAFGASVDTFARGDIIVAIENEDGETEVVIEEGYLTLLETPVRDLQGRFGKFRPYFGKANRMHLHQLPWVDYPLVVQNFLGEEGFSEAGASINYLLPLPGEVYSEATFEIFNNNDALVLGAGEEGDTVYLGHWKNFVEINDTTAVELGGSYMTSDNGNGGGSDTNVAGVDLTLNIEILDGLRTTSHTEALFSKAEQAGANDIDAWGMFTSLEQQVADRWWVFGRYDFSEAPDDSSVETNAYSAGVTFAQSEYVFWRAMFTHTDNENSDDDNTLWLQMDFSIGPHKPHAYR